MTSRLWTMAAILIWTLVCPTQWTILTIQGTVIIITMQGTVLYVCPMVLNTYTTRRTREFFRDVRRGLLQENMGGKLFS